MEELGGLDASGSAALAKLRQTIAAEEEIKAFVSLGTQQNLLTGF